MSDARRLRVQQSVVKVVKQSETYLLVFISMKTSILECVEK
jgi:hypothetical protein